MPENNHRRPSSKMPILLSADGVCLSCLARLCTGHTECPKLWIDFSVSCEIVRFQENSFSTILTSSKSRGEFTGENPG